MSRIEELKKLGAGDEMCQDCLDAMPSTTMAECRKCIAATPAFTASVSKIFCNVNPGGGEA